MRRAVLGALGLLIAGCGGASGSAPDGSVQPTLLTVAPDSTANVTSPPTVDAASTTGAAPTVPIEPTEALATQPPPDTGLPPDWTTAPAPPTPPSTSPGGTAVASPATCLAAIPVRAQVAQLVWPAVYGDGLTGAATQLAGWQVGGAVVMTFPEGATGEQLLAMKGAGAVPLLLATDEEGGGVQRFKRLGALPTPADVPATMSTEAAESMVAEHAARLAAVGIDVVFAPVVDVMPVDGGGPIGVRAFSDDPDVVSAYADAYVAGWESGGIVPVLKHFPGHGDASGDTHKVFASTPPLDELRTRDLLPYADLSRTGAGVMVGHLDVPGLTPPDVPASLSSEAITDLLRGEYGYSRALVFTDALGMSAIAQRHTIPQAAELSIEAGADVAIFTATDQTPAVIDQLVAAVGAGRLSEERVADALGRVLAAKGLDPCAMASMLTGADG
jgi:beta-N-acetylhexosaminidase